MFRKRLVATAAAAPMLLFAGAALAETTITDTRTTGVATGSIGTGGAADDIKIGTAGKVKPTAAGAAVTVNSNNKITNEGEISTSDVSNSTGIQVNPGVTTTVTNKGTIRLDETYEAKDDDKDGDLDGKFATGSGRYGIRVMPGGTVTGDIINDTGGSITIEGNNSAGVSVESNVVGNVINRGSVSVTGDNARGVQVTGDVTGNVDLRGGISAKGENAIGAAVDGDVTGKLIVQGSISSTGYRYTTRPTDKTVRDKLDADDLLQGGPAIRIAGNVTQGILLDRPPVAGVDYDGDGIPNSKDEDDDNDGKKDTEDKDLDNDGIDDAAEGTASIVQYGAAPALLIGSDTQATTIGVVGTGDDARGLVMRGTVVANGLFDNVNATGIQIGTGSGFATTLDGGIRNQGSITAQSYAGHAKGLYLAQGAVVDQIDNEGAIVAMTGAVSAKLDEQVARSAVAVHIGSGATTSAINNSGVITAVANGEKSDAVAIRDEGGKLSYVENTKTISAIVTPTTGAKPEDVTGKAIAIDVAAAEQGVRVRQFGVNDGDDDMDDTTKDADADGDGVDDADEPVMVGNIKFSAHNDTFDLENGIYQGDIDFGAGNDVFNVGTATVGAESTGAIRSSADGLTVNVNKGKLTVTNAEVIQGTAINIGKDASVIFTVDPTTNANTRFDVATANIATGAKLGLTVTDLIDGPQSYTVIKTDPGGLTAGAIDNSLLGNSPYLFVATTDVDTAAGEVNIELRRRTATEMSLTANQAAALDAVYAALGNDDDVRDAFLGADDRKDFLKLYDQMLPDQGEGLFSSLDMLTRTVSRLAATRPDLKQRYGPDSFWIQEVNVQVMRETGVTIGSETKAFGFVGGYEAMGADGGALGATLAFVTAEEKDDVAQVGEQTNISLLEAGIYWRRSIGKFTLNARGAGGYAWFSGDRAFIDPNTSVVERASADWNGFTGVASLSASYEQEFGRYYVRPGVSLDYLYLKEGERNENAKSDAIELDIDERTSSRLSAMAELAFGATYGRDLWWRPEMRIGYRHHLAGEVGDTVFRFVGGQPVTLVATEPGDGAVVIGLSLKAGTAMSYVALEGEYEAADGEDRYNLQLAGRVMF